MLRPAVVLLYCRRITYIAQWGAEYIPSKNRLWRVLELLSLDRSCVFLVLILNHKPSIAYQTASAIWSITFPGGAPPSRRRPAFVDRDLVCDAVRDAQKVFPRLSVVILLVIVAVDVQTDGL